MLNHVPTRKHAPAPILVRIKLELVNFEMIRQVIFRTIKQYDAFLKELFKYRKTEREQYEIHVHGPDHRVVRY